MCHSGLLNRRCILQRSWILSRNPCGFWFKGVFTWNSFIHSYSSYSIPKEIHIKAQAKISIIHVTGRTESSFPQRLNLHNASVFTCECFHVGRVKKVVDEVICCSRAEAGAADRVCKRTENSVTNIQMQTLIWNWHCRVLVRGSSWRQRRCRPSRATTTGSLCLGLEVTSLNLLYLFSNGLPRCWKDQPGATVHPGHLPGLLCANNRGHLQEGDLVKDAKLAARGLHSTHHRHHGQPPVPRHAETLHIKGSVGILNLQLKFARIQIFSSCSFIFSTSNCSPPPPPEDNLFQIPNSEILFIQISGSTFRNRLM